MFSIIIPTYNNLDLFQQALNSVIEQDYTDYEIIIMDDSTNNDIQSYVKSLNHPMARYYHNEPSLGAVKNWNRGLQLCQGDFIMIMHHDEALKDNNLLSKARKYLENTDIVLCNIEVCNNNKTYNLAPNIIKRLILHIPSLLFSVNCFGPSATFILKRKVMKAFDERLKWFVDVDWYYRLLRDNKSKFISDVFIISHHGHKGQITANINNLTEAVNDARTLRQKYKDDPGVLLSVSLYVNVLQNETIKNLTHKIIGR